MKSENNFKPVNTTPSEFESVKMDISKEGSSYLIANLTNLYTHPEVAVLREYTANALDSHVKAGQTTKPILVTITEHFQGDSTRYYRTKPYTLVVEDFGLGMDKEDITTIYSQYGASTKRDTNTQVGAFGLGAKSGLAVADAFKLVARKNGVELECLIRKDEDGIGIIEFVNEHATTEPNGVKIVIEVTKTNTDLADVAQKFFATWKVGSILLNGKAPYHLDNDKNFIKVQISENEVLGWIETNSRRYESYSLSGNGSVSLGGITYPINFSDREPFRSSIKSFDKIFASSYVNALIGSIDLTPPREGIRFSPRTISTLKNTFENFVDFGKETLQAHINSLPRKEAILFFNANRQTINAFWGEETNNLQDNTATWNGESFFTGITYNITDVNSEGDNIFYEMVYPKSAGLNRVPLVNTVSVLDILTEDRNNIGGGSHFVTMNLTPENLSETWFTRNIRDYAKSILNGEANVCVIATNNDVSSDAWLDALAPALDKEVMVNGARAFRASKAKVVRPAKEVSYHVFERSTGKTSFNKTSTLTGKKMLYVEKSEGLFADRLWQELKAYSTANSYTGFTSQYYAEFFAIFNSALLNQYDGVVFLDGKSPRPLIKLHPQIDSLANILEHHYAHMDNVRQRYVGIYTNFIERNPWTLENVKTNCTKMVETSDCNLIVDDDFRHLVTFFGTMSFETHSLNLFIAANKVRNFKTSTNGMFNLLEVAPLLASNVSNSKHFVAYLNAIKFADVSQGSEIKTQPYRYY